MKRFHLLPLGLAALTLAVRAGETGSGAAAGPVTKVVHQYALTSANDFPQRDPQDWCLLGSNDGGNSWTTLDIRKGEAFLERHQRRIFNISKPQAFNMYRLRIDRVRNPNGADSVQLAEFEPLGEIEDDCEPAPIYEDSISAQGDNAPLETALAAFDGRLETKWLDHASQNPTNRATWIQWQYLNHADLTITSVDRLLALRNRARDGNRVRIEGAVAGRSQIKNTLCLLDPTGHVEVPATGETAQFRTGQPVVLEGITEWTNRTVTVGQASLRALRPAATAEPIRIRLEQVLAPAEEMSWVEAEGRVGFCTRLEDRFNFEIQDGGRSLSVQVLHLVPGQTPPPSGTAVRVRGLCGGVLDTQGELVVGKLWAFNLEAISPLASLAGSINARQEAHPAEAVPSSTVPLLLTNIEQIRRLSPEELVRRPAVKVRGVVTELFGGYMQERAAGVELWLGSLTPQNTPTFASYIEVEGKGDWGIGHGPIIRPERVTNLGRGKLPEPEHCSWSQLASGTLVDQWVEISGVVRSTDGSHLLLACEGGQLMATIRSAPADLVKRLVDATIRARGVGVAATDNRGRLQGIQLLVPSLEFVEIEKAPPDPFSLPARQIGSLLQVRSPREFVHRVKVKGVLTLRDDRRYFLQDASGAVMAIAQADVMLDRPAGGSSWTFWQSVTPSTAPKNADDFMPGDRLEIVGFPEMRGYSPVLREVLLRKIGHTNTVAPVKTSIKEILGGGLDSTLVSVEAVALGQQLSAGHAILELRPDDHIFQAFWSATNQVLPAVAPGTRVRVAGVCQIEPIPYPELGKSVGTFKLISGAAGDLTVLERPPWWTLKRALVAAATGIL